MGYTHYWTQPRPLTEQEMGDIGGVVRRVIAAAQKPMHLSDSYADLANLKICGGEGKGAPEINKSRIMLNGAGPDLDHETFAIEATPTSGSWSFCKTARKPYDIVVVACLTLLAADYGWEVSSDGDVPDWEDGVKLLETATGRQFANPLIVEVLTA